MKRIKVNLFLELYSGEWICMLIIHPYFYTYICKPSINWATNYISQEIRKSTFYDRFRKAVKTSSASRDQHLTLFCFQHSIKKSATCKTAEVIIKQILPFVLNDWHFSLVYKYTWSYKVFCLPLLEKSYRFKV